MAVSVSARIGFMTVARSSWRVSPVSATGMWGPASSTEQLERQLLPRSPVAVDGGLADTGTGRHVLQAQTREPFLHEQLARRVKDGAVRPVTTGPTLCGGRRPGRPVPSVVSVVAVIPPDYGTRRLTAGTASEARCRVAAIRRPGRSRRAIDRLRWNAMRMPSRSRAKATGDRLGERGALQPQGVAVGSPRRSSGSRSRSTARYAWRPR